MTAYQRGRRLEYLVRDRLVQAGYHVIRAAGSHGVWDLVAISHRRPEIPVLLIQCKVCRTWRGALRAGATVLAAARTASAHVCGVVCARVGRSLIWLVEERYGHAPWLAQVPFDIHHEGA